MTITVWGRKNSANVQKVTWALGEMGVEFDSVRVGGPFGGTKTPDYLAINPNSYVPTYQDGDLTLSESDAILRYVARKYGMGGLYPDDPEAAATADRWATWASASLFPKIFPIFYRMIATPKAEVDFSGLEGAVDGTAAAMSILDRALEGREFLVGDSLTFGDIGPAIFARRALLLPYGAPEAPNVARFVENMQARPAFAKHVGFPVGACKEEWDANAEKYA